MRDTPTLTTDRLLLRPMAVSDAVELHAMYSHPDAMRYWHTPAHLSVNETRELLERQLASPAIQWTVCLRGSGKPIGVVGYLGNEGVPGMGYIFHPDYWRKGYAAEAVRAALACGFTQLGFDRAELWIVSDNTPSRRLAEKLGFTLRGHFLQKYNNRSAAHINAVYGLLASEWRQEMPSASPRVVSAEPVLSVRDVQASANYYRDVLGFRIDWLYGDPPTYGAVSRGEWTNDGIRLQLAQATADSLPGEHIVLYIFVQNVDALYQEYQAKGVEFALELALHPWGMREFRVRDINGMILRFGEPG